MIKITLNFELTLPVFIMHSFSLYKKRHTVLTVVNERERD